MLCMPVVASPMAGTVARLLVKVGDTLQSGQDIVILESMKMEIAIQAEADGRVKSVHVQEGDFVDEGASLIEIE
jgi:acetyl-CoA carboxylase biotin carboxyl carrier protein